MNGGVEHQLRNQLAIILGYANLLLEEMPQDDVKRADVQEIRQAAERAIALLSAPATP